MKAIMAILFCVFSLTLQAQSILPHPEQGLDAIARMYEDMADENNALDLYYLAACYWTLAGDHENAFRCLFYMTKEGFSELEWLEQESDLAPLRSSPYWRLVILHVRSNQKIKQTQQQEELLQGTKLNAKEVGMLEINDN